MAFIANTHFAVKVSNASRNNTQNVAGKFGAGTGTNFVAADCSAGTLCVQNGLIPSEGYESVVNAGGTPAILNGNTWYFNAATSGTVGGRNGDHTGIYACNSFDVNKVGSGNQMYNLGVNTLGLGTLAGERGTFTELIVGEQYEFGAGNFSATPNNTQVYGKITNGKFIPYSAVPGDLAAGEVYIQILRTTTLTEGTSAAGTGYVCQVLRAAVSAS